MIVLSILLLVVVILSFPQAPGIGKNNTLDTGNLPSNSGNSGSGHSQTSPTPVAVASDQWQTFNAPSFQVDYPANFVVDSGNMDRGAGFSAQFTYPTGAKISINAYNAYSVSSSKLISLLTALNYSSTAAQLAGVSAIKFTGSAKLAGNNFQDIAYVFDKAPLVYKVQLAYRADQPDSSIEQIFYKVVSSLKLE